MPRVGQVYAGLCPRYYIIIGIMSITVRGESKLIARCRNIFVNDAARSDSMHFEFHESLDYITYDDCLND